MKKRIILAILLVFALLFCVSCRKGDFVPNMNDEPAKDADASWGGGAFSDKELANGTLSDSLVTDTDRKIIKTVRQTVETEEYDRFIEEMRRAVAEVDGYVSNSSYSGGGVYYQDRNRYASFEIRVPADRLDEFTAAVDGLGSVTHYQESMNDVTLTYVDISGKISVLEAEEAALLAILAKAETTADLLAIRDSLTDVQGELASLRGQKKVLEDKVSYSTVNLSLNEVRRVQASNPGFFEEIGSEFSDSLEDIGDGFRGFFVWLIGDSLYILLVGAIAVGVFFLLRAIVRRIIAKRNKKRAEKEGE